MRHLSRIQILFLMFACFFIPATLVAEQVSDQALFDSLNTSGMKPRISYHGATGKVRFLGAPEGTFFRQPTILPPQTTPEFAARSFLNMYGPLFGIKNQADELLLIRERLLPDGRSVVRFRQTYKGLPVIGGELIVNLNSQKDIISVNGEISPDIDINTEVVFPREQAENKALHMVAKHYNMNADDLKITDSELSVYAPVLLGEPLRGNYLVWRIEVSARDLSPVREFVLIDAKTGIILLHFNQVDMALYRKIYDNKNNSSYGLPGNGPVRIEGEGPSYITDVDNAYEYLGDTYNFYWDYHGRDGINNSGMQMIATVRYCHPYYRCPYPNAFWNGQQMVFGEGFVADDVVGHELTHGVTEHESHLFYYRQSGAINESLSDIWGEFIDQINGKGTDTPDMKWKIGEDLPSSIGIIRNMKNPPAFGDPDSMTSPYYKCGGSDNGGVHSNSGVNNKAAYLMTDGGTFNGYSIRGLGIEKVAAIYYEVQTNYLTSAADYQDLADALFQACQNLIGGSEGITSSDCIEVKKAIEAVRMHTLPSKCKNIDVALCNSGTPTILFSDNLENPSSGNWAKWFDPNYGVQEWYYPQTLNPYDFDATYATSGIYNFWGYDSDWQGDYAIYMNNPVSLPNTSNIYMLFRHAYEFEWGVYSGTKYYFDGGVVEVNAGYGWNDAGTLAVVNGYNHTIYNGSNPLGGRKGFTGRSNGYITTKLNISSYAGKPVRFRFRIGTDYSYGSLGWFVDDIFIYTCSSSASAMRLISPNGGESISAGSVYTIQWEGPETMAYSKLSYSCDNGATWKTIANTINGTSYDWLVPLQGNNKKCLVKVTGYNTADSSIGSDKSDGPFTIEVVKLNTPNGGGEPLPSGSTYAITWTTNQTIRPVSKVVLSYTLDGGVTWKAITTFTGGSNPGTYSWTVPTVSTSKTKCKVKVVLKDSAGNTIGSDVSDGFFTINPQL